MVFEAVGKPVSPHNLPRDWRAQTSTILTDLYARGIRHNDIWRPGRLDKNSLVPWVTQRNPTLIPSLTLTPQPYSPISLICEP